MPTLLLQTNELAQDAYWLAGAAVVLLLAALYFRKILADRKERDAIQHDPRSHVVNETNYNIAREGVDEHRDQDLNASEAKTVIENLKATDQIPSSKEFHKLQRDLNKS
jgi:hypothetical protein